MIENGGDEISCDSEEGVVDLGKSVRGMLRCF